MGQRGLPEQSSGPMQRQGPAAPSGPAARIPGADPVATDTAQTPVQTRPTQGGRAVAQRACAESWTGSGLPPPTWL